MAGRGIEPEVIDLNKGLTAAGIEQLIGPRDYRLFLNPKNELYRERGMKTNPPPRSEAIALMAAHPNLIRRPILVSGGKLVLGFCTEEWDGFWELVEKPRGS